MPRETDRVEEFYEAEIASAAARADKFRRWIADGKTPVERIPIVQRAIGAIIIRRLVTMYAAGRPLDEIETEYLEVLEHFDDYWIADQVMFGSDDEPRQYLDHDDMLWMLSLGILFDVPKASFGLLAGLIDRDGVVDRVFEFLLRAKLRERPLAGSESYEIELYGSLRQAIEPDRSMVERTALLVEHVKREWEKEHRRMLGVYTAKAAHDTY